MAHWSTWLYELDDQGEPLRARAWLSWLIVGCIVVLAIAFGYGGR